ncbi:MAG: hypothetical protein U0794_22990, partial [Isosphaeraceae bacterium]
MSLLRWNRPTQAASVLTALAVAVGTEFQPPCHGQQAAAPGQAQATAGTLWTPLVQALRTTANAGVPTVVVITSRSSPASAAFREALAQLPEARSWTRSVLFAEMPAEIYATQVKNLGISVFPTFVVYRRGRSGLEAAGARHDLADARQVFAWLGSLSLTPAPGDNAVATAGAPAHPSVADPAVQRTQMYGSSQGYPSEQAPPSIPPKVPPALPPAQPPVYTTPPQQPVYAPQPYVTPVPAPPPVYVQTQTPAMIVQQAP